MKFFIIKFLYCFGKIINYKKKQNLRIIMMHNLNKNNFKTLEKNLIFLKKKYNFINPRDINHKLPNKNNILLTFDDGFKNNFIFAKKVLKKINVKAVFFILTDFVASKRKMDKIEILRNIFPQKKNLNLIKHEPMTWSNLNELLNMGHMIGIHGKSHKRLSSIRNSKELKNEIISPKRIVKKKLSLDCNYFAFPFGTCGSINKKSMRLIKLNYKYIFSGIRGDNKKIKKKQLFFRDNIDDSYDRKIIDFFINGYGDFLYRKARNQILTMFSRN
tara:strand:+ start:333 stop:1151 length:819 start_codon:yes stop_codon:yes gene_type:complete